MSFFAISLFSLTNQPVEDRVVGLAESCRGVELHHLPSMHHQHPVAVHDGVDPGDTSTEKKDHFPKKIQRKMNEPRVYIKDFIPKLDLNKDKRRELKQFWLAVIS